MAFLTELWLPIILAAVLVFIVSSVIHIGIQLHNKDYTGMNNEDAVLDAFRSNDVGPGEYMFPHAESFKAAGTPEMVEKMKKGPVGMLTILPAGGFNTGKNLAIWFAYSIVIGAIVGYVAFNAIGPSDDYLHVFRITGAAAVLGYAVGYIHNSIWKGVAWKTTFKFIVDGVIYALVTAGTFAWLWPGVPTP